jgi:hypothetical protein
MKILAQTSPNLFNTNSVLIQSKFKDIQNKLNSCLPPQTHNDQFNVPNTNCNFENEEMEM